MFVYLFISGSNIRFPSKYQSSIDHVASEMDFQLRNSQNASSYAL